MKNSNMVFRFHENQENFIKKVRKFKKIAKINIMKFLTTKIIMKMNNKFTLEQYLQNPPPVSELVSACERDKGAEACKRATERTR